MAPKRRMLATAALACGALVVTAAVGAATITGTAGNDTLRGTTKADRLNGKAGNDQLYGAGGNDVLVGGAGNDLLVGGPGADRLSCGSGRDIARGDARDVIGSDCETVTGVPNPAPPAPPPAPAPTPPPPPVAVTPGSYQGQINQGNFMYFELLGDRTVGNWRTNEIPEECEGKGILRGGFWAIYPTPVPIANDGTFVIDWTGTANAEWLDEPATFRVTIAGRVEGSSASGTVSSSSDFVSEGERYRCASGSLPWVAGRTG